MFQSWGQTIHSVYTDFRLYYYRYIRIFQEFHPSARISKNILREHTDRKTCAQNEKRAKNVLHLYTRN